MNSYQNFVEAIENGKIVKVSEQYAKREGLPIIRRPNIGQISEQARPLPPSMETRLRIGERKHVHSPPKTHDNWKKQQVVSELVENFHWHIRMTRRKKGLTRKQFAKQINEPEENLMEIESGSLPSNDFVLINKIQQALKINLRRDRKDFSLSSHSLMEKTIRQNTELQRQKTEKSKDTDVYGSGIEILEDEI